MKHSLIFGTYFLFVFFLFFFPIFFVVFCFVSLCFLFCFVFCLFCFLLCLFLLFVCLSICFWFALLWFKLFRSCTIACATSGAINLPFKSIWRHFRLSGLHDVQSFVFYVVSCAWLFPFYVLFVVILLFVLFNFRSVSPFDIVNPFW